MLSRGHYYEAVNCRVFGHKNHLTGKSIICKYGNEAKGQLSVHLYYNITVSQPQNWRNHFTSKFAIPPYQDDF